MRLSYRLGRIAVAAAAVAVVAGCSSDGGGSHSAGPRGIRGTELSAFACNAKAAGKAVRLPPSDVLELRVCPVSAPEPFNRPDRPVSLVRGSTRFQSFLAALSLPDEAAKGQQACPAYAELLPTVIARTKTVALIAHLPVDACGHTLGPVSAALASVIGTPSATS